MTKQMINYTNMGCILWVFCRLYCIGIGYWPLPRFYRNKLVELKTVRQIALKIEHLILNHIYKR